jgi:DNA-binding LacI/PurR family transcriptional regulator
MYTVEGGQAAAAKLLDAGCTAICGGNDIMALGAIRAARARGLRVPGDVSVTGMDDSLLTAYLDPPLTTIRQSVREMSMAAVSTVLDEIRGTRAPRTELLYRPELVVRRSTAPAPAVARLTPVKEG